MKILIIPDSFKGSLTSEEVCRCITVGIQNVSDQHDISALPFADGGEGFSDCLLNICKGNKLYANAENIYGRRIQCPIGVIDNTAVIDCASASGLQPRKDVMHASSYGTGMLIKYAVEQGFRHIILGLGGTGCCDGGAGVLAALGAKFYVENYTAISRPNGASLNEIFGAGFRNIVKDINFTYACDVENAYAGKNGAAVVFAPQKGASPEQVLSLDEGLKRLQAFLPTDVSHIKGAGAAGGICGGLFSVYQGNIRAGFDILAEHAGLEKRIAESDLVITGEGKTDEQTLMGKLPYRVATLAKQYGKPCVLISGCIENVTLGDKMVSLTDSDADMEAAIANAAKNLTEKSKLILQIIEDII